MDARYEAYSFADPHYYDSPVRWGAPEEFALTQEPAPQGWVRRDRGIWAGLQPEGVQLPDQGWKIHVSATLEERRTRRGDSLPYRVEQALHFSNAGGIYLARDPETGQQLVLKEARPYAGLDQRGTDAVARLTHEAEMLRRLDGVLEVPRLLAELTSWEHRFWPARPTSSSSRR
ncbi:hypothetical protein ABT095_24895 [Kitasatospora sp. NPDC002227]|uniref:class III lanthionine synthetase LanKC N-terminal domain-containing protein n=1 Tax=Kitasatospora sp. NPDC002227 TaxID=3154773 RepID=UPI00331EA2AF